MQRQRLQVGELVFDRSARALQVRGEPVHLTPLEWRLFERLARTPGRVVTHRQLLADVWGSEQVDQLHYLRARGIAEGDARALLIRAFAADALAGIEHRPLRARLESLLPGALPEAA